MAVLLAAGSSRRWGMGNKLLARRRGTTLLERGIAVARLAPAARLVIVVGWQAARVAQAARLQAPRSRIVRARDHREGMGASLRAVARALWPAEREALIFLADTPDIDTLTAGRLIRAARIGDEAVRPCHAGVPGHPVLLRDAGNRLARARGDAGPLRGLRVRMISAGRATTHDVDRPGRW